VATKRPAAERPVARGGAAKRSAAKKAPARRRVARRRPTALVGIDLGGTKVQAVRVEGDEVVASARRSTPSGGPEAVVAAVAEVVRELGDPKDLAAIGMGAPGAVETGTGVVRRAPNLEGFDRPVPLGELVAEALGGVSVAVDNDVNVAALAEHRLGAGVGSDDLLAVFVGTGVGGGLVHDGRIRRGPGGAAGEIGHVIVKDGGRRCGCGGRGHLEAYAGRAGMERTARKRAKGGAKTKLVKLAGDGRMKSSVFAEALADGDPLARELVDEAAQALGAALASAVALVDLDRVVLGGGLGDRLGAPFVAEVEQAVRDRLFVPDAPFTVVPAALGDLAGARGAALLARDR
jgi:glucokinase